MMTNLRRGYLFSILLCALPLCLLAVDTKVSVKFFNALKDEHVPITIFWRNPAGEERPATRLIKKGDSEVVETFVGHVFVAYDQSMGYFREYRIPEPSNSNMVDIPVYELIRKVPVARFTNNLASGAIEVFWKNTNTGEEKKVSPEIAPGGWHDVETHKGHTFVAKTLQGEVLKTFLVQAVPGVREEHTVGDSAKATFYNAMKKSMRIFWYNTETGKETSVSDNIAPGDSHPVFSHPGHKFVVYDDKMRRSKEYTIGANYNEHQQFHVDL